MFTKILTIMFFFSGFSAFANSSEYRPAFKKAALAKNTTDLKDQIQKDMLFVYDLFQKKSKIISTKVSKNKFTKNKASL